MIKLSADFLLKSIQGNASSFANNLPADAELLDIKYDLFSRQVLAVVRSDNFEDVADEYPTPELKVTYTSRAKSEPKQPIKPTPSTHIKAKTKPKPAEKVPVAANQDVRAVEKEFSPEQRELLSFTIDGDYVIIKPTQYLKAEWNEINNVVKSIGGKWVKGDFFSYWEIPPE